MIELKSTLEPKQDLLKDHLYMIDFSKLTSVNDLIMIFASMGIGFPSDHPNIDKLKPFLNLQNPISTKQPDFIPLPKLEKIDGK